MTTKLGSAADEHYALHVSRENDTDWICPACGPPENSMNAMEFWKSSMRWSDKMNEKEACEFAEAYNAALRSQLEEAQRRNKHLQIELDDEYAADAQIQEQYEEMGRDLATAKARIAQLERACRDAINIMPEQVPLGVTSALRILRAALAEPQSGDK